MNDLIFKNINNELEQIGNDCLKGKEPLDTKFGNAKINKYGYYRITSRKEGNNNKYLHVLIWEDHYGKSVPKGYVIHHINSIKNDNRIQNLQCVKDKLHIRFHNMNRSDETLKKMSESKMGEKNPMYGQTRLEESRIKQSKTTNTTGYYGVSKKKDKTCKQGFIWQYTYHNNGKRKIITRVDINKLKEKVLAKGLPWYKLGGD